jgi:D-beta-D-heptose 7-phosphate kinase/D-beta-D-heptose 1-phosphate adenosyltransferase
MTIEPNRLTELSDRSILVLGDPILDRYTWGQAERVSPEAPVLVLRADRQELRLGGAASVAWLLAALETRVTLAGVIGDDGEGDALGDLLRQERVDTELLIRDDSRPTTVKDRFLGRSAYRQPHPVLRVDHESVEPIAPEREEQLAAGICRRLVSCQAVLVSDYAKGVCTPRLLRTVISAAQALGVPVLVDPARIGDYARYRGAQRIAPNRTETGLACGRKIEIPSDALAAGQWLRQEYGFGAAVIKLDADGLVVVDSNNEAHLPTRPRTVCDVTGAGDMVLAILGLGQAAGWTLAMLRSQSTAAGALRNVGQLLHRNHRMTGHVPAS